MWVTIPDLPDLQCQRTAVRRVQRVKEEFEAKPQLAELVQEHGEQHQTLNAKNHTEQRVEMWISVPDQGGCQVETGLAHQAVIRGRVVEVESPEVELKPKPKALAQPPRA